MYRAALFSVCLAAACSGGEEGVDAGKIVVPTDNNASKTTAPKFTEPPPPVAPPRRGYDPPLLFAKDRGVHFEIIELDDLPYDGKIVTYHDADKKIIATERIFEKGHLIAEHEYWPNAKPKLEVTYHLGSTTTNRYDAQGNEIKPSPSVALQVPRTRALNWTYNYNAGNARLEAFVRQNTAVLVKFLGEPDSKLNNVWIYRNMRITDARTKRQHTSVRFSISGNSVSSVVPLQ